VEKLGGCLCGKIRYSINATLIDAGFCHCQTCRAASGAPTLAWLTIPFNGFVYTSATASVYYSSKQFQREFCPSCGTQIAFRAKFEPKTIDVTLGSLDDSNDITLDYHIWCAQKVTWLHLNDGLPQYLDAGPDA